MLLIFRIYLDLIIL